MMILLLPIPKTMTSHFAPSVILRLIFLFMCSVKLLFCSMMFKHELCIVTLRKRHYTYGGSIQMSKSCGMNLYSDKKGFKFLYISQVNRYSKHCRTCNRCVEGFDHHCRVRDNIFLSFFLLCTIIGMVGYS